MRLSAAFMWTWNLQSHYYFNIPQWIAQVGKMCGLRTALTLIYPAHFEDVPCQSGVNHIFEG